MPMETNDGIGDEVPMTSCRTPAGTARHCCYGVCKSDSRYFDREYMQGVTWTPFPKPCRKLEKCQRWLRACGRDGFTVEHVKRWTYMCSKHFVGGHGPTTEHPDPVPAKLQVCK